MYSYSDAALQLIFAEIKKNPEGIIRRLRENSAKNKPTPGAKEFSAMPTPLREPSHILHELTCFPYCNRGRYIWQEEKIVVLLM